MLVADLGWWPDRPEEYLMMDVKVSDGATFTLLTLAAPAMQQREKSGGRKPMERQRRPEKLPRDL
jgi:hypothetical protein